MQSRCKILFLVLYLVPLSGVGTDLYAPSLPAITNQLNTSIPLVKFTLAIYLLGFSIGQLIFGTLSDIYGRKPMLLVSLALFCLISFAATIVHNIYFLLLVRLLQGFSAAGPSVITKAILTDTMSGTDLKRASIYLITVWGLSPIIAPAIGGYLQHYFGWTANFYFFALYSFSMWAFVIFLLKETNLNKHEPKLKVIFKNYSILLKHRTFVSSIVCMGLTFSIIMIFNIFTPFLVQNVLGYSAITYGELAMIIGIGFLAGSLSNRWIMMHFETLIVNRIAITMLSIAAIVTLLMAYEMKMSLDTLGAPVFLMAFVGGLLQTNLMTYALSLFPNMGGAASATNGAVICLIAGLMTTGGSLVHHATDQTAVSWIYFIIIAISVSIYWIMVDKACAKEPREALQS